VGIGLVNMRRRLETLYGEGFELKVRDQAPSGVAVLVSLPFTEA
jgi:LytS/YehU family sensor histidine kinase